MIKKAQLSQFIAPFFGATPTAIDPLAWVSELINPESDAILFEKPSETKQQRRTEKEGATKLMSDAEIKKMNIEITITNEEI